MGQPLTHSVALPLPPSAFHRSEALPAPLSPFPPDTTTATTFKAASAGRLKIPEAFVDVSSGCAWILESARLVESPCRPSKDSRNKLPRRAVPSTTRKLYLVRKRTIEIGYLPNRSTLLSASTIGRTNGVARDGKEFIFLRLEWISNLSFWRWQPVVKLRCT